MLVGGNQAIDQVENSQIVTIDTINLPAAAATLYNQRPGVAALTQVPQNGCGLVTKQIPFKRNRNSSCHDVFKKITGCRSLFLKQHIVYKMDGAHLFSGINQPVSRRYNLSPMRMRSICGGYKDAEFNKAP